MVRFPIFCFVFSDSVNVILRGICDCASRGGGGGRGGTVFLVRFIRDWLPKFSPLSLCLLVLFLSLVLLLLLPPLVLVLLALVFRWSMKDSAAAPGFFFGNFWLFCEDLFRWIRSCWREARFAAGLCCLQAVMLDCCVFVERRRMSGVEKKNNNKSGVGFFFLFWCCRMLYQRRLSKNYYGAVVASSFCAFCLQSSAEIL